MLEFITHRLALEKDRKALPMHRPLFGGIDSDLVTGINNIGSGLEVLARDGLSAPTRREIVDRIFRSVGRAILAGKADPGALVEVERATYCFYADYYSEGYHDRLSLSPEVVEAIRGFRLENETKNLAHSMWEHQIDEITSREAEAFQCQHSGEAPVVVSVAFGGNEPAMVLAAKLAAPLVHVKTNPHQEAKFLPVNPGITDKYCLVVEDYVKTGDSIGRAFKAVQAFSPSGIKAVVISSIHSAVLIPEA